MILQKGKSLIPFCVLGSESALVVFPSHCCCAGICSTLIVMNRFLGLDVKFVPELLHLTLPFCKFPRKGMLEGKY
ncbi:hypothetical protein MKW98_030260 [Papaver atlanticum]|uniref:Uncharacterized protein n=1 Tax=Papaver atlanticum TaxID=357466 RepID=A0AAD4TAG1_9MAGN|nr:hypothetical protein MKW98_030260 [Papaver atlanticum]